MIIDFHTHIFSPAIEERREELCRKDACFGALYSNPKATLGSVEELLASMDDCGVEVSVVQNIGWVKNDLCIQNNNYILEMVAKYPDRLVGFCSCQPKEGDAALKEMERCVSAGARGIGELRPDIQEYDLNDSQFVAPLVAYAIKQDLIISIHASEPVGHEYAGKGKVYPQSLYEFAREHAGLKIVAAHVGGGLPFYELMPEVTACLKTLYYDTAALPFLYRPDIYRALMNMIDSDKVLYGSDWPLLSPGRVFEHIQTAGISRRDRDNICGINANRLLNIY